MNFSLPKDFAANPSGQYVIFEENSCQCYCCSKRRNKNREENKKREESSYSSNSSSNELTSYNYVSDPNSYM